MWQILQQTSQRSSSPVSSPAGADPTSLDCMFMIYGCSRWLCSAATWEYPPATSEAGSSPRPKGDKVYVPREPLGKHPPSSLDAESPLSTLKSRLGAFQQPIPELREGSMSSSATASLGSTTAETDSQIREGLPNGFPSQSQQQRGSGGQRLDAASTASTAADTKPASALSAAFSEGSDASRSQYAQASLSADAPATPPSEIREEGSDDLRDTAGAKHADRADSAPRSIPGSRRQVGRARQLRVQHSAGLSGTPSGTNSSTGTAMFWTGSQAHGISFADDNEIRCKEPQAASVSDGDKELAHSPLDTRAQAYGLAFEPHASEDHGEVSQDDGQVHVPTYSTVINGVHTHSSFDDTASAKEALVERADEDIRQHGISNIAAAAVAEVDAEKAQQEGEAQGRSHPAASLSGELPPGELLSEPGSVDEEREALGVSPVGTFGYACIKNLPQFCDHGEKEYVHPMKYTLRFECIPSFALQGWCYARGWQMILTHSARQLCYVQAYWQERARSCSVSLIMVHLYVEIIMTCTCVLRLCLWQHVMKGLPLLGTCVCLVDICTAKC